MINLRIKESSQEDFNDIMLVEMAAFENDKEIKALVTDLLNDDSGTPMLSLMAEIDGKPVGHIIFTRAYINNRDTNQPLAHILAPLAVIPEYQKQGIGGALIKEGLKRLKAMGSQTVFVLGHIEYYPKYGFIGDAKSFGFPAPFTIPEELKNAWMIQHLTSEPAIEKGATLCCISMNKEHYWRE